MAAGNLLEVELPIKILVDTSICFVELINLNPSSQVRKITDLWNMDTSVVGRK